MNGSGTGQQTRVQADWGQGHVLGRAGDTATEVLSDNQEAVCSPSLPAAPGSSILHHHPWPVLSFHPSRAPSPVTKTCPSMSLPSLPPTSLNSPTMLQSVGRNPNPLSTSVNSFVKQHV